MGAWFPTVFEHAVFGVSLVSLYDTYAVLLMTSSPTSTLDTGVSGTVGGGDEGEQQRERPLRWQ